jgi:hypothetical protein
VLSVLPLHQAPIFAGAKGFEPFLLSPKDDE